MPDTILPPHVREALRTRIGFHVDTRLHRFSRPCLEYVAEPAGVISDSAMIGIATTAWAETERMTDIEFRRDGYFHALRRNRLWPTRFMQQLGRTCDMLIADDDTGGIEPLCQQMFAQNLDYCIASSPRLTQYEDIRYTREDCEIEYGWAYCEAHPEAYGHLVRVPVRGRIDPFMAAMTNPSGFGIPCFTHRCVRR